MKFLIVFLLPFFICPAVSHADRDDEWMDEEMPSLEPRKHKSLLKQSHKGISNTIGSFSNSIDTFFADPRMDVESNGSRLRLNLLANFTNKEPAVFTNGLNFRLDLPRTKKKWNFILVSFSKSLTENDEEALTAESPDEAVANQDYFAGLRYFTKKSKHFNVSTDAGVKLVWPPDPFAQLRLRESLFVANWEFRFTQALFWFESRGIGANIGVDLDRPLSHRKLFRFANSAGWLKDEESTNFNHSFNLFETLSSQDGIVYSTGVTSLADPTPILQTYFVTVRYRRKLYANALFAEVQPVGTWPRDRNFGFRPGIIFRLELVMGPNYLGAKEDVF